MREIKYKVNNGFVRDEICYAVIKDNEEGTLFRYWDEDEDDWLACCDIRIYTGLKDKNGKEIYEGDIIKREFEISKEIYDPTTLGFVELEITNEGYFIGVVNFRPSEGWVLNKCTKYNVEGGAMKKRSGVKIYKNYSEVIGNIYDNPELLKGE